MIPGAAIKGAIVGCVAVVALAPAALGAIDRLQSARAEEARLAAALAAVPAAAADFAAVVARLRGEAARGGMLVERASADGGRLAIRLSGSEDAVLALVEGAERRGLRLVRWSLAGEGSAVRLDGEAVRATPSASAPLARVHQRALFGREIAADTAEAPANAPELVGVVGRIGQDAVAMVRASDGATRTLRLGEGVDGWTLESLAIDAAYFTRGGQRARVMLPAGE